MVTRTLNTSGLGVSRKGVASSRSEMAPGDVERRAKGARGHHFGPVCLDQTRNIGRGGLTDSG